MSKKAELQALKTVAEALNRSVGLQEALEGALEAVMPLVGSEAGWIRLLEEVAGLRLAAARNLPPALEADDRVAMQGTCQCIDLLSRGHLEAAVNILECERLRSAEGDPARSTKTEKRSVRGDTRGLSHHASIPIRAAGRTLGVLNLSTPSDRVYTEAELDLLTAVGDQLGVAVERARLYEAERQRAAELTALNALASAIGETLDLQFILATALEKIVAITGVDGAECHLADDAETLKFAAHYGLDPAFAAGSRGIVFRPGEGIPGRALASRAPVCVPDAISNGRYLRQDLARSAGYRSLLCIPILGREALLGTFMLYSRKPREFPPEMQALLMTIGRQLALAVERARLHQRVKAHHIEEQAALLKFSKALLGETEAQAVINLAVQVASEALNVEFAALALMDAEGASVSAPATLGWPVDLLPQLQNVPLEAVPALAYAIHSRSPVVIPDETRETRFAIPPWITQMGIAASLLAPMLVAGKAIGGLVVNGCTARDWSGDEVRLLALIANDAAQALERARLYAHA